MVEDCRDRVVATAITHFFVAASLSLPAMKSNSIRRVLPWWAVPVTAGLLAVAPDLDTPLLRALQVPRGTLFSHRGFFHSAMFLTVFAGVLAVFAARRHPWQSAAWLTVLWAASAITHPLLDMLTDGGGGVMLLYPFTSERLFFPWRPIHVSPLSIRAFFGRAGYILKSEFPFCVAALAIGLAALSLRPRRRYHRR